MMAPPRCWSSRGESVFKPRKCAYRGRGNSASSAPSSVMRMPLALGVVGLLRRGIGP